MARQPGGQRAVYSNFKSKQELFGSVLADRADTELAGIIVHCLSNGLSMEHAVDPERVNAATVEAAISATLTALIADERPGSDR